MATFQQDKDTLTNLIKKFGYWSKEVKEFNSSLPYLKMVALNNLIEQNQK